MVRRDSGNWKNWMMLLLEFCSIKYIQEIVIIMWITKTNGRILIALRKKRLPTRSVTLP
jgi:hypothetical protein